MTLRITAVLLLALLAAPAAAGAQPRLVEQRSFSEGQGKLLAYYSAALTFTPMAAPRALPRGSITAGLELGYIPPLDEEQRRVGDKPEATNLVPVFARPRLGYAVSDRVFAEASWIPPVRLFDVKANVVSASVAWTPPARGAMRLTPRVAAMAGTVEGAITCARELADASPDLASYWALVCYARESIDRFEPRHLLAEVVARWERDAARVTPYAGLGVRGDFSKFDIGVIRPDGTREPDHPILEMRYARPYGTLGATVRATPAARATAELLYAPGSLLTIRVQGVLDARRR